MVRSQYCATASVIHRARTVSGPTPGRGGPDTRRTNQLSARNIIVATGTKPARPAGVEFDENRVLDSDGILDLKSIPSSMVVVGAGVIGIEYASMFAALGTKVTVVEKRDTMLDFCDPEIVESLRFHLRDLAVTFRFGGRSPRSTSDPLAPSRHSGGNHPPRR